MICRRVSYFNRFKGNSQHIQEYDAGVFRHPASSASIFYPVTTRAISTGPRIKPINPHERYPGKDPYHLS